MAHPTFFDAIDPAQMLRDYPIGADFEKLLQKLSSDELRARQDERFLRVVKRAWDVPFYRRHWSTQGLEPGDISSLDDIDKIPVYDKSDLMASIERSPPWGEFHGLDKSPEARAPHFVQTTSGTTGSPQVLYYGPKSREMQNLLLARLYKLQGIEARDVVHSVYGHGLINAGHYVRETFTHWMNATFLSAGTGAETRSVNQVQVMQQFGATVLVGFVDYIKKLGDVAREQGLTPGEDIRIRLISGHFGLDSKEVVSNAWGGAICLDWYGVADTGIIAGEGPDQDGMMVMEDAQFLEILDIDTGSPAPIGMEGDMVCTCLFKDDLYPIIRFNTHDVSAFKQGSASFQRIEGFLGRSDNMVKLRGINVFPQAIGPMLDGHVAFAGEFICRCDRDEQGRDELTVMIEVAPGAAPNEDLRNEFKKILKNKVGLDLGIELARVGELSPLTELESRQKPIRLIDLRFKS